MVRWQITVFCPVHRKNVYLIVEARDPMRTKEKALGMKIHCPWGPVKREVTFVKVRILRDFQEAVFRFKAGEEHEVEAETANRWVKLGFAEVISALEARTITEPSHDFIVDEILAVTEYPWKPSTTVSTAPITPLLPYYAPTPPAERLYHINPEVRDRLLIKLRWWEK